MHAMRVLRRVMLDMVPVGIDSCEHCRTVTWAGVPACGCAFGRRAVDEETTRRLCVVAGAVGNAAEES